MARPAKNWAKFTVTPGMTGTVQPFNVATSDRYTKGKEPKAPSNAPFTIHRVVVHGAPGADIGEVQKAVSGAVLVLEGQGGKKIELGPLFLHTKECNPWTDDAVYNLELPVQIPAGAEYNVVISYEKASQNTSNVDLFVVLEGAEG
jgi:hypothetical protein